MRHLQYAELRCQTNHSFLTGASHPDELMQKAHEIGLAALAITDRNGVYGMPKAYRAHKQLSSPTKLIVGAELLIERTTPLTFLAQDRKAYGLLCRMITTAHAGKPKGKASLSWTELSDLLARPGHQGIMALACATPQLKESSGIKHDLLHDLLGKRFYIALARSLDGKDKRRAENALSLSRLYGCAVVATNDVHYHEPNRRKLQDVMTAIRLGTTLNSAGTKLFSNAERYLKSPSEMHRLFEDLPTALHATLEIAEQCTFSPSELRYRYPSEWIPTNETAQSYLEKLVLKGTASRYPQGPPIEVLDLLDHELKLIDQLGFADYFLTIWEIVEFARSRNILCQGRGSAANSAVCYVLGITAIDPAQINLLFERFISVERGEPPDIDVDFEHERREEVIQHIYEKYGRDRAGMVAAVICYKSRSSIREVSKVFEIGLEHAKNADAPDAAVARQVADELHGFPRHLSIHSGGFTLSADPIIETVPIEPARMEGRTIVQWDKDDLDAIGLLKVDVLALGMLSAIRKCCDSVGLTLATIRADDPKTYKMIQKADTVGTFQIESRAQMNMLGRLRPENFYDLVIQVAIVRPGPIVGKMVHPYLRRRRKLEPVEMPHPRLKPILEKTLGVPLFQEQVMKMAIELGGFTPGEADELRRAIGAWRSNGSIEKMGQKLKKGFLSCGLSQSYVARLFEQIKGFSEYGFPESHAASFALLAYASAYLKCHHPAEFTCALINSQPMGFYSNHTLIDDVKRHGVQVLSVHPNKSDWDCKITSTGALQLGFRVVKGMSKTDAGKVVAERQQRLFSTLADVLARASLSMAVMRRLAMGDAFRCFGFDQRSALWELLAYHDIAQTGPMGQLGLFSGVPIQNFSRGLFDKLDSFEAIQSDYSSYHLSARGHPMQILRTRNLRLPRHTTAQAKCCTHGQIETFAGLIIARQRPPTAKGTVFATLEDEDGFLDLILHKDTHREFGGYFSTHAFLIARGVIQRDGYSVSMLVRELRPIWADDTPKKAPELDGLSRHFEWKY